MKIEDVCGAMKSVEIIRSFHVGKWWESTERNYVGARHWRPIYSNSTSAYRAVSSECPTPSQTQCHQILAPIYYFPGGSDDK